MEFQAVLAPEPNTLTPLPITQALDIRSIYNTVVVYETFCVLLKMAEYTPRRSTRTCPIY